MSKVIGFFANLRRSTKITLISCVSFVLMTFLILCFFIMSPITPSDKAGHTYGRESISQDGTASTDVSTAAGIADVTDASSESTTTVTTTRKEYKITITTGTGRYGEYYSEGRINAGEYETGYSVPPYQTTTAYSTQPYIGYTEPVTGGVEPYTGEYTTQPATVEPPTEIVTQAPTEPQTQAPTAPIITQAPTEAPKPPVDIPQPSEVSVW